MGNVNDSSIQNPENGSSIPWSEWFETQYRTEVLNKWILPTTEYSLKKLYDCFEQYRQYVKHNPLLVSEIESALYWISYLLTTTRFHNSRIISELLYSCSSLLTLFNDNLLRQSYRLHNKNTNASVYTLHTILQFIEYVQVFAELSALQMYGCYGKWIIISIIEVIKAMIRLILLFHYQQGITYNQYIRPLNRQREYEQYQFKCKFKKQPNQKPPSSSSSSADEAIVLNDDDDDLDDPECSDHILNSSNAHQNDEQDEQVFQLKSSGRFIRNIDHAPPKEKRMWITPAQTRRLRTLLRKNHRTCPTVTQLNRKRMIGELLHIMRPVLHLATGAMAGGIENRWAPYLVSLGVDVISLKLLRGSSFNQYRLDGDNLLGLINKSNSDDGQMFVVDDIWNWSEQIEIQRRYIALFMYLLRSPFYDQYTKQRLIRLLSLFANYIPLFGRLLRPFINYLPHWQQVYFYVWN